MASRMTFEQWLRRVDGAMSVMVGLTHSDIADWNWYDAYESGETPRVAARQALAEDDTFSALGGFGFD